MPADEITLIDWIAPIAAAVQAIAAAVIVGVTWFLGQYAKKQADLAQKALQATDRQARLRSVGLLHLGEPAAMNDTRAGSLTKVQVKNRSAEPALDVVLHTFGLTGDWLVGPYGRSAQIPMIAPGGEDSASISSENLPQVSNPTRGQAAGAGHVQSVPPGNSIHSHEEVVVEAEWKSIVGAVASVSYVWRPDAQANAVERWRLRDLRIRPSGGESDDEVVVNAGH